MGYRGFIARRYLFSRKEKTVINLISWISLIGIAVSTIALVVVMSVYNGIGELTQSLFNVFDPELLIEPAEGKSFRTSDIDYAGLTQTDGVNVVSQIVEENAWITLRQAEAIVQLRGVDETYGKATGLDTMILEGDYTLTPYTTTPYTTTPILLGWNIMVRLGVNSMTNVPLAVHIPKRGTTSLGFTIDEAFNNGYAYPAGTFRIQEEIDNLYTVTDIDFVRQLMGYTPDEVTALAVTLAKSANIDKVKRELRHKLGDRFTVKDRYEQKPLYYKIFRSERLGVFLILSLIVLISTLNIIASLSLLIINKSKDIATLRAIGMTRRDLQRTFFTEGVMIAIVGVVAGLLLGFVICLLQQHFGIVKLGANAIVDAFPVSMRLVDFIATLGIVTLISSLVVWLTVKKAKL
ncbi:MAG: ABC transporter permease [Bacteroidales bacterium]|nr:ABC transporter permease [Bacteroidales bacterium]